ncbi:MAG: hypothetical protein IJO72_02345 [Oscillospiraceae bacterium]|nr:hypothetical protein [Oscillospiraceae bacterium]
MFILGKKKYFNEIYFEVFKKVMLAVDDTNNILTYYGAKPNIEENKVKFVLSTYLYNLYFVEASLQSKYWSNYKKEINQIIEAMIVEIANRTGYNAEQVFNLYTTIRTNLGDAALNDEKLKDVNPLYIAAIYYLQFTFKDTYDSEKLGYHSGEVETAIAKVFENTIKETIHFLDSK